MIVFETLINWVLKDRCWCEFEYLSSFTEKNNFVPIMTVNWKCIKCGNIKHSRYYETEEIIEKIKHKIIP